MRRKRLQHEADILCHMFCGWRLTFDQKVLTQLGAGTLQINVLTQDCRHDGQSIETLGIARELHCWLTQDLAANNIPIDALRGAVLSVKFRTEPLRGERRTPQLWTHTDEHTRYISCYLHSESRISTDDRDYTSAMDDYEEWPEDWWTRHEKSTAT